MHRALALLALAATSGAATGDGLRHVNDARFAAIGLVRSGVNSGSGFLIGPCHAATAAHVTPNYALGARVHFVAMQSDDWARSKGTVIATGGSTMKRYFSGADWALIRLDRCLGDRVGWLDPGGTITGDAELLVAGYPVTHDSHAGIAVARCERRGFFSDGTIGHSCVVPAGMSGGPLLVSRQGRLQAVGIIVANLPKIRIGVAARVPSAERSALNTSPISKPPA